MSLYWCTLQYLIEIPLQFFRKLSAHCNKKELSTHCNKQELSAHCNKQELSTRVVYSTTTDNEVRGDKF